MTSQLDSDAYSTYQAGNLERLVMLMNANQQLRFKQAVVRQTIFYVAKRLPPDGQDEGEGSFIALANLWLEQPTEENAQRAGLAAYLDCMDGGVRYFDYSSYFLEPAWAASGSAYDATKNALLAADQEAKTASQWQLDTAWAILNDEVLPPLSVD